MKLYRLITDYDGMPHGEPFEVGAAQDPAWVALELLGYGIEELEDEEEDNDA